MSLFEPQTPVRRKGIARRLGGPAVEPLESRIAPALATPFPLGGLDGANGFLISGPGQVGHGASVIGDVNGDGFDDLLIGAPNAGTTGAAFVLFGKADGFDPNVNLGALDGTNGFAVRNPGLQSISNFATNVGAVGDLNGDGFADLAVAADAENVGANNAAGRFTSFSAKPASQLASASQRSMARMASSSPGRPRTNFWAPPLRRPATSTPTASATS